MAREVMRRKAGDNEYLHKDFHGALSAGLIYLEERYGADAVREYLRDFAREFYAPSRDDLKKRGLLALKEHFEKTYEIEGGQVEIDLCEDQMVMEVAFCPAIDHMRKHGYEISPLWSETIGAVNQALCEDSDFEAELVEYDSQTGRSVQRFRRRRGP